MNGNKVERDARPWSASSRPSRRAGTLLRDEKGDTKWLELTGAPSGRARVRVLRRPPRRRRRRTSTSRTRSSSRGSGTTRSGCSSSWRSRSPRASSSSESARASAASRTSCSRTTASPAGRPRTTPATGSRRTRRTRRPTATSRRRCRTSRSRRSRSRRSPSTSSSSRATPTRNASSRRSTCSRPTQYRTQAQLAQLGLQNDVPGAVFQPSSISKIGSALATDPINDALSSRHNAALNAAFTKMRTRYTKAVVAYKAGRRGPAERLGDPVRARPDRRDGERPADRGRRLQALPEARPEDQSAPAVKERIAQLEESFAPAPEG